MSEFKPFEQWAQRKSSPAWLVGAARSAFSWAIGKELSEADFDAALKTAAGGSSGDGNPFDVDPEEEAPSQSEATPSERRKRRK